MVQAVGPVVGKRPANFNRIRVVIITIAIACLLGYALVVRYKRHRRIKATETLDEAIRTESPERIREAVLKGARIPEWTVIAVIQDKCSDKTAATLIEEMQEPVTNDLLYVAIKLNKPEAVAAALKRGAVLSRSQWQTVLQKQFLKAVEIYVKKADPINLHNAFKETVGAKWQAGTLAIARQLAKHKMAFPSRLSEVIEQGWEDVAKIMIDQGADIRYFRFNLKSEAMAVLLVKNGYREANLYYLVKRNHWGNLFNELYDQEREKSSGIFNLYTDAIANRWAFIRKKIISKANLRKDLFDNLNSCNYNHHYSNFDRLSCMIDDIISEKQCQNLSADDVSSLVRFGTAPVTRLAKAGAALDTIQLFEKACDANWMRFARDLAALKPPKLQEALDAAVKKTASMEHREAFFQTCIGLGAKLTPEVASKTLSDIISSRSIDENIVIKLLENGAHLDNDPDHKKLFAIARQHSLIELQAHLTKDLTLETIKIFDLSIEDLTKLTTEKQCLNIGLDLPIEAVDHLLEKGWTIFADQLLARQGDALSVFLKYVEAKNKCVAKRFAETKSPFLSASSLVDVMKNGWQSITEIMIKKGVPIDTACFIKATQQKWVSTLDLLCKRTPSNLQESLDAAIEINAIWEDRTAVAVCLCLLNQGALPKNIPSKVNQANGHVEFFRGGCRRERRVVLRKLCAFLNVDQLQALDLSVTKLVTLCTEKQLTELFDRNMLNSYAVLVECQHFGFDDLVLKIRDQLPTEELFHHGCDNQQILTYLVNHRASELPDNALSIMLSDNANENLLEDHLVAAVKNGVNIQLKDVLVAAWQGKIILLEEMRKRNPTFSMSSTDGTEFSEYLISAIRDKNQAIAAWFVDLGARIHRSCDLLALIRNDWAEIAEKAINQKQIDADVDLDQALYLAACHKHENLAIKLLEQGASPNFSYAERKVLDHAVLHSLQHLAYKLLDAGASYSLLSDKHRLYQKAKAQGWQNVQRWILERASMNDIRINKISLDELVKFCSDKCIIEALKADEPLPITKSALLTAINQKKPMQIIEEILHVFPNDIRYDWDNTDEEILRVFIESRISEFLTNENVLHGMLSWRVPYGVIKTLVAKGVKVDFVSCFESILATRNQHYSEIPSGYQDFINDSMIEFLQSNGAKITVNILDYCKEHKKLDIPLNALKANPDLIHEDLLEWAIKNDQQELAILVAKPLNRNAKVKQDQYPYAVLRGMWDLLDHLLLPAGDDIQTLGSLIKLNDFANIPLVKALTDGKVNWAMAIIKRGVLVNETTMQALLDYAPNKIDELSSVEKLNPTLVAFKVLALAGKEVAAYQLVRTGKIDILDLDALRSISTLKNKDKFWAHVTEKIAGRTQLFAYAVLVGIDSYIEDALRIIENSADQFDPDDPNIVLAMRYALENKRLDIVERLLASPLSNTWQKRFKVSTFAKQYVQSIDCVRAEVNRITTDTMLGATSLDMALKIHGLTEYSDTRARPVQKKAYDAANLLIYLEDAPDAIFKDLKTEYIRRYQSDNSSIEEMARDIQNYGSMLHRAFQGEFDIHRLDDQGKNLFQQAVSQRYVHLAQALLDLENEYNEISKMASQFFVDQSLLKAFLSNPEERTFLDCARFIENLTDQQLKDCFPSTSIEELKQHAAACRTAVDERPTIIDTLTSAYRERYWIFTSTPPHIDVIIRALSERGLFAAEIDRYLRVYPSLIKKSELLLKEFYGRFDVKNPSMRDLFKTWFEISRLPDQMQRLTRIESVWDKIEIDQLFKQMQGNQSVTPFEEKAKVVKQFSKKFITPKTSELTSLLTRMHSDPSSESTCKPLAMRLIDEGSSVNFADLKLAVELVDKTTALKMLKAFFSTFEDNLMCPALGKPFDQPIVLDCGHTVEKETYDIICKPNSFQSDYNANWDFTCEVKPFQCPACHKKFKKSLSSPSYLTKALVSSLQRYNRMRSFSIEDFKVNHPAFITKDILALPDEDLCLLKMPLKKAKPIMPIFMQTYNIYKSFDEFGIGDCRKLVNWLDNCGYCADLSPYERSEWNNLKNNYIEIKKLLSFIEKLDQKRKQEFLKKAYPAVESANFSRISNWMRNKTRFTIFIDDLEKIITGLENPASAEDLLSGFMDVACNLQNDYSSLTPIQKNEQILKSFKDAIENGWTV